MEDTYGRSGYHNTAVYKRLTEERFIDNIGMDATLTRTARIALSHHKREHSPEIALRKTLEGIIRDLCEENRRLKEAK